MPYVVCAVERTKNAGVIIKTALIISGATNDAWKRDAVDRGHAEYDAKTGEWQWKECSTLPAKEESS